MFSAEGAETDEHAEIARIDVAGAVSLAWLSGVVELGGPGLLVRWSGESRALAVFSHQRFASWRPLPPGRLSGNVGPHPGHVRIVSERVMFRLIDMSVCQVFPA